MHAVVVNVTVKDREAAGRALNEQVVPPVSQARGFVGAYWVGLEGDKGTSIAVFESEEAAKTMAERAQAPGEFVEFDSVEVGRSRGQRLGSERGADHDRHRLRLPRLRGGAAAGPRRGRDRARVAGWPATPMPTCSPTRSSTRCWVRPPWVTSASTSRTPTSATATPTRSSCCAPRWRWSAERGHTVVHVDATVVIERPALAPHRERDARERWPRRWGSDRACERQGHAR